MKTGSDAQGESASADSVSQRGLIRTLQDRIDSVLEPLLRGHSRCALVEFPNYPNVGDNAIWLGEVSYLRSKGIRIAYRADTRWYSRNHLAEKLGSGVILLQGGGNFGDLYAESQRLREEIIATFPNNRIILLPQTMYFRDRANLEKARAIFDSHPDLNILVRERRSLDLVRNEFRTRSLLCPDMAFLLGALPYRRAPDIDVLWLWRNDQESAGWAPVGQHVVRADWVEGSATVPHHKFELLDRLLSRYPRHLRFLIGALPWFYNALARRRLAYGCRMLTRARTVITDRLHGHILSLLLGIPHVLLDNNYGKVRSFYETWTKGSELVFWADSPDEAIEKSKLLRA